MIEGIGGQNGWYSWPLGWRVRGLAGPVRRRPRAPTRTAPPVRSLRRRRRRLVARRGDPGPELLRLRAEMRVPGLAWLELVVDHDASPGEHGTVFRQRALFHPHGLPATPTGRLCRAVPRRRLRRHAATDRTRGREGGVPRRTSTVGTLAAAARSIGSPSILRRWTGEHHRTRPPADLLRAVGGHETFDRLVHRFYQGVAGDPALRALYPEEDLGPAEERFRMFLEQYWGGPDHVQRPARPPPAADAARALHGHPRRSRPLAQAHARRRGRAATWHRCTSSLLWDYLERAAHSMVNSFG